MSAADESFDAIEFSHNVAFVAILPLPVQLPPRASLVVRKEGIFAPSSLE